MIKLLRRYLPAVLSLVIITALAAVSFADQHAAKNQNKDLPEQAAEKAKEAKEKAEEQEGGEASSGPNHGHCVSYAARLAKDDGLEGSAKGAFISTVAKDEDAVSLKVAKGEATTDTTCTAAIAAAKTAAASSARSEGKSEQNRSDSEERGKSAGKGKSGS